MVGGSFPISEYYRSNILDAVTVSRGGGWWTAVLLIKDPKSGRPFIGLYRWQFTESGWKIRKRFTFRRISEINSIIKIIQDFSGKLSVDEK